MASLSYSSVSMYLDCPQKFKFRYIDKIPEQAKYYFSFGSSIHDALEYFYGAAVPPTLEQVLNQYTNNWVSKGYKDKEQELKYFEEGKTILEKFYNKNIEVFKPALFTEYRFDIKIDGIPFLGYIDRIDKADTNSISIIDYKTGAKLDKDRIALDTQLTVYQLACEKLLGLKVANLTLYHVNSLTAFTVGPRSEQQIQQIKEQVKQVALGIEQQQFAPKPEDWKCSRCDYRSRCPAFSIIIK